MLRSKFKYINIRHYINLDLLNLVHVMCVCVNPVGPVSILYDADPQPGRARAPPLRRHAGSAQLVIKRACKTMPSAARLDRLS